MNFYVMTLFPELIDAVASSSILKRGIENGLIRVEAVNFRDYSKDKHRHVDDYPYGGGSGMLIEPEPVYDCFLDLEKKIGKKPRVIYMTPKGRVFRQEMAEELAKEEDLVFLAGHYEGIDERVLDLIVTDRVSIGDYVLTGGELPAMVMIDAISRHVPGVLSAGSADIESFQDGLLEYPQYTRPEEFMGMRVPEVLLSGHHLNVEKWQREMAIRETVKYRPELIATAHLTDKERAFANALLKEARAKAESEPKAAPEEPPAEEGGAE